MSRFWRIQALGMAIVILSMSNMTENDVLRWVLTGIGWVLLVVFEWLSERIDAQNQKPKESDADKVKRIQREMAEEANETLEKLREEGATRGTIAWEDALTAHTIGETVEILFAGKGECWQEVSFDRDGNKSQALTEWFQGCEEEDGAKFRIKT